MYFSNHLTIKFVKNLTPFYLNEKAKIHSGLYIHFNFYSPL